MPSNDFNQESSDDEQIEHTIKQNYGSNFSLLSKDHVNGENTSELYQWLRQNCDLYDKSSGKCGQILWNYEKFLIDGEGKVVQRYGINTMPEEILPDIIELLG